MPNDITDRLRRLVHAEGIQAPADSDPFDILAAVAGHSSKLAAALDSRAGQHGAGSRRACHRSWVPARGRGGFPGLRRTPAVIGRQAADAVHAYLAKHGLSDQAACVITPGSYPPGHLQTVAHLLEDAIGALEATPAECALITASPAGIDAAQGIGANAIGYARTPADREHLADAGATGTIPSLADLTLRLRARPLPN